MEPDPLVYNEAVRMLVKGAMPVIVESGDAMHVLSVIPTSNEVVAAMVNPNPQARLQFIVNVVCEVKREVDAGRVS